jgi:hypothetical protein
VGDVIGRLMQVSRKKLIYESVDPVNPPELGWCVVGDCLVCGRLDWCVSPGVPFEWTCKCCVDMCQTTQPPHRYLESEAKVPTFEYAGGTRWSTSAAKCVFELANQPLPYLMKKVGVGVGRGGPPRGPGVVWVQHMDTTHTRTSAHR